MKKINDFISAIKKNGVARTNRFWVMFSTPPVVKSSIDLSEVLLMCNGAALPGMSLGTVPIKTYGPAREVPYEKLFEPITLRFVVDSKMKVKEYFDTWIGSIIDKTTNNSNFYNDYVTDISIFVYDYADKASYYVLLRECYPKSIGAITLDAGDRGFMQLEVTFNSLVWYSKKMDGQGVDQINMSTDDLIGDLINDFNGFQQNSSDIMSVFTGLGERINNEVSSLIGRGRQAVSDVTNKASQIVKDIRGFF